MTISGQHRGLVLAVLALTGLLLGACALTVDPDEARLCRMIAAGLEGGNARLSFGGARSTARTATANQGPSAGVALTYASTARDGVATSGAKSIVCLFDPSRPSAAVSERLISVETDAGPMAPARLYMLKRFWLATAEGI